MISKLVRVGVIQLLVPIATADYRLKVGQVIISRMS